VTVRARERQLATVIRRPHPQCTFRSTRRPTTCRHPCCGTTEFDRDEADACHIGLRHLPLPLRRALSHEEVVDRHPHGQERPRRRAPLCETLKPPTGPHGTGSSCRPSAKTRQLRTPTPAARTTACGRRRSAQPIACRAKRTSATQKRVVLQRRDRASCRPRAPASPHEAVPADERDEARFRHRAEAMERAVPLHEQHDLLVTPTADRLDEPAALRELRDERRRNM
jgi:hypothetical protein